MRITFDPMVPLRQAAAEQVNRYVQGALSLNQHIERAHKAKLDAAQAFLADGTQAEILTQEALLRNINIETLASLIVTKAEEKGDPLVQRELMRQTILKMIEDAQTPDEITSILEEHAGQAKPINVVTGERVEE